jgi:glycyl-tRNA synthetase beta chain
MRWFSEQKIFWIRPIRNLIAIFNKDPLNIKFIDVAANNYLIFENFVKKPIKINSIDQYLEEVKKNFIIIDQDQRRAIIEEEITKKVHDLGYELMGDNRNLINEIIGISDFPLALSGKISEDFLHLPKEILRLTMKNNQKFICLQDKNANMARKFIFIANKNSDKFDEARVIKENEKILTARLNDAKFFIEEDLKTPLEKRAQYLEKIIFHDRLGSMADKAKRVEITNKFISLWVSHSDISLIHNISLLSKADLSSKAVAEFPELQGVMGAYYAKEEDYDSKISQAVKEHYLPAGPNSPIPQTPLGCLLSISDKLDSVCGLFLANEKPTSSKDPFAIRRATLGIIRIIGENQIQFLLKLAVKKSLNSFSKAIIKKLYIGKSRKEISKILTSLTNEIIEFFLERLRFFLKEKNIDSRVIEKVFSQLEVDNKSYNLLEMINKIYFIDSFIKNSQNQEFLQVIKRISNISQLHNDNVVKRIRKKYFQNNSELILFKAIKEIKSKIKKPLVEKNYEEIFKILGELTNLVKAFLDENRIEDDNDNIKQNRILILLELRKIMNKVFVF